MEGPFRSAPTEASASAPRDQGIVGDVIAQFADPLAFYRELVQNSIDAGTPSVEVRIEHDEPAQLTRVSVRDQGEGMDRDILENQLLVLFRSTKERDPTKIGKFGIGFKSVLAPGPQAVVVQTSRGGKKLTLHLYPDLRYELFDTGASRGKGTTVELQLAMETAALGAFVRDSRLALERWCRHASVPIRFVAPGTDVRIDAPLALDGALVEVTRTSDDGAITAVVGLMPGAARYAGFFNHGLMLHETDADLIGPFAMKIQDSRLGHTLSRDNVIRNAAFHHAVTFASELTSRSLAAAAVRAVREAAEARDVARYQELLEAIHAADITLYVQDWLVPLIEPVGERTCMAFSELPQYPVRGAQRRSALTAAFAAAGKPLVDFAVTPPSRMRISPVNVADVEQDHVLIEPVAEAPHDVELLREVGAMLDAAYRAPSSVVIASVEGALASQVAMTGQLGIVHVEHARRTPFRFLFPRMLVLSAAHPHVAAARRRAANDLVGAASLLARAVLVHYHALDRDRSAKLLAHTVARLEGR